MDPATIISLTAAGSGAAGYVLKRVVDHLLGRRPLRVDEATKIRMELRGEIELKKKEIADLKMDHGKEIAALGHRLASLEEDLEKAERERDERIIQQERYKLDVYRTLINFGANKELVDAVLAIQER